MTERVGGLRKRVKPFTMTPNETIDDWTISYRALGLLIRILRMPEGFVIRSEQLANEGKGQTRGGRKPKREGREAIRTTLRELSLAGYYRLEKVRKRNGSFMMQNSVTEDPDPLWAEQAAVFGGKAVPLYEQEDGSHMVKYPDGTMKPDGFPPPAQPAMTSDDSSGDHEEDSEVEAGESPGTGFRAPGSRAPANPASGNAEPGRSGPLSKRVNKDGQEDSVPASQVRRDHGKREDPSAEGQITISGEVEPTRPSQSAEAEERKLVMGIARGWLAEWGKHGGLVTCKGDPLMALKGVVEKARSRGASENEIKFALMWSDRDVPDLNRLGDGVLQVRRGWRPKSDWKPGDGRQGGQITRQRGGQGAMAGTNLFIADMTPEERAAQNPLRNAVSSSDFTDREEGMA